tara:strand:- start:896 stop:1636 length:741 start_codon:yes stop_codon:yes gene_type:complete
LTKEKPVALIVGAGDYIGAAIAKRFASGGFKVCVGRRSFDKLTPLVREIKENGGEAIPFEFDARKEDVTEKVFKEIENNIGPLDLVVFNPGGNVYFPISETTSRVFRKVWEMSCFAGFLTGREAAKYMVPRKKGAIFFTGATASIRGSSGYSAFASGKFGLRALSQSMARELGPENIHVAHLIIDAAVDTKFVRQLFLNKGTDPDTLPEDTLMKPASIAETYWNLFHQTKDGWTHEIDLRPFGEQW